MASRARERRRNPLRSLSWNRTDDAVRGPRGGSRTAVAVLAAGDSRRRTDRFDLRRAGDRQVAACACGPGKARERAAYPIALSMLALSYQQRALSIHPAARAGCRLRAG